MRALSFLLPMLVACGDNVVTNDAGERIDDDLGECCLLLFPLPQFGAIRACVAEKTAGEMCRRLDCIVFDEWLCPGGVTAEDTRNRADGVTECMCGGVWP